MFSFGATPDAAGCIRMAKTVKAGVCPAPHRPNVPGWRKCWAAGGITKKVPLGIVGPVIVFDKP